MTTQPILALALHPVYLLLDQRGAGRKADAA
jgi:hypothetical protein